MPLDCPDKPLPSDQKVDMGKETYGVTEECPEHQCYGKSNYDGCVWHQDFLYIRDRQKM